MGPMVGSGVVQPIAVQSHRVISSCNVRRNSSSAKRQKVKVHAHQRTRWMNEWAEMPFVKSRLRKHEFYRYKLRCHFSFSVYWLANTDT